MAWPSLELLEARHCRKDAGDSLASPGLGQECAYTAADRYPADRAQLQVGGTLGADEVATGHEDYRDGSIQAHLASPLFLQLSQLFLHILSSWGLKNSPAPSGTRTLISHRGVNLPHRPILCTPSRKEGGPFNLCGSQPYLVH